MLPRWLLLAGALVALAVRPCPAAAVCGDGKLDAGEQCDDGNTVAGDCCSPTCSYEPIGSPCDDRSVCTTNDACDGVGVCRGLKLSCEDGDGCTVDRCAPQDGCHHDPVDFENTLGQVSPALETGACEGQNVPRAVRRRFNKAAKLVARAQSVEAPRRRRALVRKAAKELRTANGAVHRAKRHVIRDCSDQLAMRVTTARSRAVCLLVSLKP